MRIGLVLDDTLDTPDGVQQYVLTVGKWMQQQGHEVHYIVGETKRTDIPDLHSLSRNVHVAFNGNRMSMPLPTGRRRLRKFWREYDLDVLHVQTPYSPFMAGRLIRLAPAATAIVGTFHVLPYSRPERMANRVLAWWNRQTGRRFDAMIAASPAAAEFARDCYGFAPTVIPHPFDYEAFRVPPSKDTAMTIVYMARLVERKGAQWFLAAVQELHRRGTLPASIRVLIGGRGPLKEKLEAEVLRTGLSDYVTFKGFIPETDKAAFLARADIAVFPSVSGESFGISLLEALAAARGVVLAGDNPGYRSVMPDQAQLHDPTDTEAYADLLEHWLSRPAARSEAARAQQTYAGRFDTEIICRQVEQVYKQALQSLPKS